MVQGYISGLVVVVVMVVVVVVVVVVVGVVVVVVVDIVVVVVIVVGVVVVVVVIGVVVVVVVIVVVVFVDAVVKGDGRIAVVVVCWPPQPLCVQTMSLVLKAVVAGQTITWPRYRAPPSHWHDTNLPQSVGWSSR